MSPFLHHNIKQKYTSTKPNNFKEDPCTMLYMPTVLIVEFTSNNQNKYKCYQFAFITIQLLSNNKSKIRFKYYKSRTTYTPQPQGTSQWQWCYPTHVIYKSNTVIYTREQTWLLLKHFPVKIN